MRGNQTGGGLELRAGACMARGRFWGLSFRWAAFLPCFHCPKPPEELYPRIIY